MQYRLLRNNKESGPYTKAQLEEIGLKPYDLLWIEGRGGAWLYASEITELKSIAPVVEEQPFDRFYKGKEKQASTTVGKQNASTIANTQAVASTATLKPPKPRFRISGDKVVMIDDKAVLQQQSQQADSAVPIATKTQQPVTVSAKPAAKQEIGAHIQSVGLDWEDMYSEWQGEDKQPEEQEPAKPAKVQTMEEVRQRYEETKLKQLAPKQNNTANNTKQNIMAAIAIAVLVIGGYAGYKLNNSGDKSQHSTQTAPVEKAEVIQDENNEQQNTNNASGNTIDASAGNTTSAAQQTPDNSVKAQSEEIKNSLSDGNSKTTQASLPVENKATVPNTKKEEQSAPAKNISIISAEKYNQKTTQQTGLTEKNKVASNNNTTTPAKDQKEDNAQADVKKSSTTAPIQTPTVVQPAVVKPEAPSKRIGDYITVSKLGSSNGSVQNVLLSVKNVTDFPIDLAVIDIQYYGANGRFQKGETMYVKSIGAGSNVNVRIPDSKTSHSITYKVSLVSSEQKTLYLVGD